MLSGQSLFVHSSTSGGHSVQDSASDIFYSRVGQSVQKSLSETILSRTSAIIGLSLTETRPALIFSKGENPVMARSQIVFPVGCI